jgi:DsbC/DsbD-like thiol-disulfide interchange protein/cytochrome c biogenesis protein CcdA
MRLAQLHRCIRPLSQGFCVLIGLVFAALPAIASADESNAVVSPRATVSLISDADAVAPGSRFRIGLRQKLAPHWHTYWKNPGDAGEPTRLVLTLPPGASAGPIEWPGPERIEVGGAVSFGYRDEITLPVTVNVPSDIRVGETFAVEAKAEWLVCAEQCVPESGIFRLRLPVEAVSKPAGSDTTAAFDAADLRRPQFSPWMAGLAVAGEGFSLILSGPGLSPETAQDAAFFPDDWGPVDYAKPARFTARVGEIALALARGPTFDASQRVPGVLAITDSGGATRWYTIAPRISMPPAPSPATAVPLWQALAFAFLGGLILNLMPCVFPILAMKATAVARLSGGELREVRLSALLYIFGILTAFTALAAVLLTLRAGGSAVGWGFQFQSPVFIAAMSWLLLLVGLNLSGVFEVRTSGLGTWSGGRGRAGSFLTGLLAVVVATPCTAPFMGVAIGAALVLPPILCVALFLAMGGGLALPYAALAVFPGLSRRLPRPGPWMLRLRQIMALPMYASVAWLLWVLARQTGEGGLIAGLAGTAAIGVAAWLFGLAQRGPWRRPWTYGGSVALALASVVLLLSLKPVDAPVRGIAASEHSEPYSERRLDNLRAEGRPVFVNMTADWCLSCLVNERIALSTDAVQAALKDRGVVYLKGDWTRADPEITRYLRAFGRDGVPFYALYPAGSGAPLVLPPVLTETAMLDAIAAIPRSN